MWFSIFLINFDLLLMAVATDGRRLRFTRPLNIIPSIPPDTINSINVTAYLGRWYQMYASLVPNTTFERNGYCVCADYFAMHNVNQENIAFGLTNSMRIGSPTGTLDQVNGTVFKTNDPGKYEVQFDTPSYDRGNYWIVALGDIPAGESQYPWSIVSTPFRTTSFILARNVDDFRSVYAKIVFEIARKKGFTSNLNKPLETYQGGDCLYPDVPSPIDINTNC